MQRFRLILSAETVNKTILHETVSTTPPEVAIPLDVCVESSTNHRVSEGHFSKSTVFTSNGNGECTCAASRRDPGRTSDGDSKEVY